MRGSGFALPLRVYYEDTDCSGIVYHAAYLRFMERARTEWLRALGFEHDRLRESHGVMLVVSKLAIDYRRPARLGDALAASVAVARIGRASLLLDQEVRREPGETLCIASVRIACVDTGARRARAIPESLSSELLRDDRPVPD